MTQHECGVIEAAADSPPGVHGNARDEVPGLAIGRGRPHRVVGQRAAQWSSECSICAVLAAGHRRSQCPVVGETGGDPVDAPQRGGQRHGVCGTTCA